MKEIFYLLLLMFCIVGCKENSTEVEKKPQDYYYQNISIIQSGNPTYDFMANDKNGNTVFYDWETNHVSRAVCRQKDGNWIEMVFNEQGVPSLVYSQEYIVIIDNISSGKADFAVIETNSGQIKIHRNINFSIGTYNPDNKVVVEKSSSVLGWYGDVAEGLKFASNALSAFSLVTAYIGVAPGPHSPIALALSGTSLILSVLSSVLSDQFELLETSALAFSIGGDAIGCGGGGGLDCLNLGIAIKAEVLSLINTYKDKIQLAGSTLHYGSLSAPALSSPVDGATNQSTSPTLSWNASTGAASYTLQVSTSSSFTSLAYNQSGLTGTSQQVSGLSNNTKYYWRVNATNSVGTSAWSNGSSPWNFTTIGTAPPAPTLSSPANNATSVAIPPTLSWNASTGAASYTLQVSTSSSFTSFAYNQSGLTGTSQQVSGLSNNTKYYWRVNATNSVGTSAWSNGSSPWNFRTIVEVVNNASISGVITNATTGGIITSASVTLKNGATIVGTTTSNSSGQYSFSSLSQGTYGITVTKTNYIDFSDNNITIANGENKTLNISMSPSSSNVQYRIILTWGSLPDDLDAHLLKGSYHVYYDDPGSQSSPPYALLDIDDITGYGPETISIYKLNSDYCKFYINNFSDEIDIKQSQAVVKVYSGTTLLKNYSVPSSGTGDYWYVFDIGSSGNIVDKNYITNTPPGGKLSIKKKK